MEKLEDSAKQAALAGELTEETDHSLCNKKQNYGKEKRLNEKSK